VTPQKLDQKRLKMAETLRQYPANVKDAVRDLSETVQGWSGYYGKSPDTRDQLAMLEQHLADLMQPWLSRLRSQGPGKEISAAELKAILIELRLPVTNDQRNKLEWVELLLARSRPKSDKQPAHGLSVQRPRVTPSNSGSKSIES
jgi:hypothetical protein